MESGLKDHQIAHLSTRLTDKLISHFPYFKFPQSTRTQVSAMLVELLEEMNARIDRKPRP